MTWFSDRSGIASTGMVIRARKPATPSMSEARITRKRLRIDHSMIDSITVRPPFGSVPVGAFGRDGSRPGRGANGLGRDALVGLGWGALAGVGGNGAGVDAALGVDQEGTARR